MTPYGKHYPNLHVSDTANLTPDIIWVLNLYMADQNKADMTFTIRKSHPYQVQSYLAWLVMTRQCLPLMLRSQMQTIHYPISRGTNTAAGEDFEGILVNTHLKIQSILAEY